MQIYLFSSEIKEIGERIQGIIQELLPSDYLEILRSVESLSWKLQEPQEEQGDKPIVVAVVRGKEELLDLISIRELLYPVRLVLVLPDAEKDTVSLGHRLRPNFLTYIHSDLKELEAVLQRMLGKN